jgi:hypothetical protein
MVINPALTTALDQGVAQGTRGHDANVRGVAQLQHFKKSV